MTRILALIGLSWFCLIVAGLLAWGTWRNAERARDDDL